MSPDTLLARNRQRRGYVERLVLAYRVAQDHQQSRSVRGTLLILIFSPFFRFPILPSTFFCL